MSQKQTLDKPPSWFKLENYQFVADLDISGWEAELQKRLRINDVQFKGPDEKLNYYNPFFELGLNYPQDRRILLDDYNSRLEDGLYYPQGRQLSFEKNETEVRANLSNDELKEYEDDIEMADDHFLETYLIMTKWLQNYYYTIKDVTDRISSGEKLHSLSNTGCFLKINMDCPDRILTDQFRKWLVEHRKKSPLKLVRRGHRDKANAQFTTDHFRKWTEHRILSLFDIQFWAKLNNIHLKNELIAS